MVKQYPYILQVLSLSGGGQDDDGNNIPPSQSWSDYANCRDEAGNGKQIATVDGTMVSFSFLVQMPKNTPAISVGTEIKVMDGTETRCDGKVIYSRKDQLHTRIWV